VVDLDLRGITPEGEPDRPKGYRRRRSPAIRVRTGRIAELTLKVGEHLLPHRVCCPTRERQGMHSLRRSQSRGPDL
jgi:hypothetical protein